jgi:hypothetical protein
LSGAVCSATPAFAGVNSVDACPAYAGSVFQQSLITLLYIPGEDILGNGIELRFF